MRVWKPLQPTGERVVALVASFLNLLSTSFDRWNVASFLWLIFSLFSFFLSGVKKKKKESESKRINPWMSNFLPLVCIVVGQVFSEWVKTTAGPHHATFRVRVRVGSLGTAFTGFDFYQLIYPKRKTKIKEMDGILYAPVSSTRHHLRVPPSQTWYVAESVVGAASATTD